MKSAPAERQTLLFVHNNNDMYGAEVILLELLKRLDRQRFYPIVVLPSDSRHINRFSVELNRAGIEFHFVRMAVLRRMYSSFLGLLRLGLDFLLGLFSLTLLIVRKRVVLVHTNTISVLCSPFAAWLTGRRHVWHIHEIIVGPVSVRKAMHNLCCRLPDVVVAVSGPVKEHILMDCPRHAGKIVVIHNGIDPTPFSGPRSPSCVREALGIPEDAYLVGMVGRVCRWKGQLQFAEAAKLVLRQRPGTYFVAVGGVFDREKFHMERFRQRVEELGLKENFRISDFRTDVADVLSALNIFVLPSTQPDPFPTVVLEAMAASKPVIATAHGGPLEMVAEGKTGYLVTPGDPRALARAILRMAESAERANEMGGNGRARAAEVFSLDRFIRDFEALYEKCLAPTAAGSCGESRIGA